MKTNMIRLWENNPGQIFFRNDVLPHNRNVSFATIAPKNNGIICSNCNTAVWNATNFMNDVHFCPKTEIDVTLSDFKISK